MDSKFKVWVKTIGDPKYYTNAVVFNTTEEADAWGRDLMSRWMLAVAYEVRPLEV